MNLLFPPRGQNHSIRNIQDIYLLGGVHGNERIGVHIIQRLLDAQEKVDILPNTSLNLIPIFGNPKAIHRNSRYIESDLNREFNRKASQSPTSSSCSDSIYEVQRAEDIRKQIGADQKLVDFMVDLHSTTSNMEHCFIVPDWEPWTEKLCYYVSQRISNAYFLYENVSREQEKTSSALSLNHVTLEVGPIPQGVPSYKKVEEVLESLRVLLEAVDFLNGKDPSALPSVSVPKFTRLPYNVDYPRDNNGFSSVIIHPEFEGKDYTPLKIGQPLFITPTGDTIFLDEQSVPEALYSKLEQGEKIAPMFIGEAAYVEKGIAFITATIDEK
jgi:aspartoacylase